MIAHSLTQVINIAILVLTATCPSAGAAKPLRIVFAVDETGSLVQAQAMLAAQSRTIFSAISDQTGTNGFEIALVGFGRGTTGPIGTRNPRNFGQPVLVQRCSNQEADFLAGMNDLVTNGATEPGFQTIQEIAGNNINPNNETSGFNGLYGNGPVCGDLLNGDGFCLVMVTDEDSDVRAGESAASATADLLGVGGVFSIIGNVAARNEYATIADMTGGGQYDLTAFVNSMAGATETMTNVVMDCVDAMMDDVPTETPTQNPVRPPIEGAPPVRVVLAVDETGSLSSAQSMLIAQSPTIFSTIQHETRSLGFDGFEIAVVGFGRNTFATPPNPRSLGQPILHQRCSNQEADFLAAVNDLEVNGGTEPGFQTIREFAGNNINPNNQTCCSNELYGNGPICDDLLDGKGFCVVMVTDEASNVFFQADNAPEAAAELLVAGGVFSIVGSLAARADYAPVATATGGGEYDLTTFVGSMAGAEGIMTDVIMDCAKAILKKLTKPPTMSPTVAPTMSPTMAPTTSPTAMPTNVPTVVSCAPVSVPKKRLRPSRFSKASKAPNHRDATKAPKRRDATKAPKLSKAKASKAPSSLEGRADDGFRGKHAKASYSHLKSTSFPSLCPEGSALSPPN